MKKSIKRPTIFKIILLLLLFIISISGSIYFFYNLKTQSKEAKTEITNSFIALGTKENLQPPPEESKTAGTQNVYTKNDLPDSAIVNVSFVNQYPELPTGCEITSLTEVLNYLGYDVSKETLAKNYLDCSDEIKEGCFMKYFVGSPYNDDACGCFAPALVTAANRYLKSVNSSFIAHNISFSEPISLYTQIANGIPVIVWTSFDYDVTTIDYQPVVIDSYQTFQWPSYEHCVVLMGYDLSKKTVTFADPTHGIVTRSMDSFVYYYEKYYYQAMIIK